MSLQKDEGGVVRTAGRLATGLPQLPLEEWEATKDTLHLWAQIVGKIRLALAPARDSPDSPVRTQDRRRMVLPAAVDEV